ncbi:hypothetical protein [Streptomyces sp. SM13]|uniref:hypothetical protein n=1 Tax=Streptomyces sp. SM13 TaxID=1983803 RepID=UPI000CD5C4CB|nr:hypothetical protein [Streptomyces sp. SM13]
MLCAEAGEEPVGAAAFAEREDSVHLSRLRVAPARWRSGVGAAPRGQRGRLAERRVPSEAPAGGAAVAE